MLKLAVLLPFSLAALSAPALGDPVRVEGGFVSGAPGRDPSVTVFRGVP
jgi:hypothetical protein